MKSSIYLGAKTELSHGDQGQIASTRLVSGREHIAPAIIDISPGVWSIVGLSVANAHVIDAPAGLIVIDSGNGLDEGKAILAFIREVSDRPIAALVYTHSHYCAGAGGVLGEDEGKPIYAHAKTHDNFCAKHAAEGPAYHYRLMAQYGVPLPQTGPDANPIATASSKKGALAYLPPSETFSVNGAISSIAGEEVQVFTDYSFDTDDSLILYFPKRQLCVHNHVTATFPNIVSVAGGGYRDPLPWLAGLDRMRTLDIHQLLGVHGLPIQGPDSVRHRLTIFRDALQFCYDQSIRAMNHGIDVDSLLSTLELPAHLAQEPALAQSYAEWEYGIRGIFAGVLGWYGGDAVDLHPVPPDLESQKIVAGFGGLAACLRSVQDELDQSCWSWAASLARHCVRVAPQSQHARKLLAQALRKMGQVTPAWTTRNVYLTQAGEWERQWSRADLPPRLDAATAKWSPPGTFVRAFGYRLDPRASSEADLKVAIQFTDCAFTCGLHIRRGVAEYCPWELDHPHCSIACKRQQWLRYALGESSWQQLCTDAVSLAGDWNAVWPLFDPWPPRINSI